MAEKKATQELQAPTLAEFVRAGYPCVFLPTVESEVAEKRIRAALSDKRLNFSKMTFGVWKATTGFRQGIVSEEELKPNTQARDLVDALAFIEVSQTPIAAVFHNIREYIKNPQVIQQMVDTILAARYMGSHIFLVGAYLDVPPELRSLITFVDCPLPTRAELVTEYRRIVSAYSDELDIPKPGEARDDLLRHAATAAVGLDTMGAENALALSFARTGSIDLRVIQSQKEQEVRKSDVLEFVPTMESMDNVGGFASFKEWMRRRAKVFTDEARKYGLPYPKGVLIVGVGGTGKSLVAKATATYLKLPLLRLDMGKIYRSLVGESEAAIRMALQVVEAVSPVVLWIDEIDRGMSGMRTSGELDSGVGSRVTGTILTWRQETRAPVFVAATANEVTSLPSMVYRKGRFDEVWATDLPNEEERVEIFAIHLRKRGRDASKFDLELLSRQSMQYVGAEIETAVEDAMFYAFDKDEEITTKHISKAIKDTKPQAERDKEEIERIRKWCSVRARQVSGGKSEDTGAGIGFMAKTRKMRVKHSEEEEG